VAIATYLAATIVMPMPVSLRLSRTSKWLLHRHLSHRDILADRRRITTFLGEKKLERIDMCDIMPGNM